MLNIAEQLDLARETFNFLNNLGYEVLRKGWESQDYKERTDCIARHQKILNRMKRESRHIQILNSTLGP